MANGNLGIQEPMVYGAKLFPLRCMPESLLTIKYWPNKQKKRTPGINGHFQIRKKKKSFSFLPISPREPSGTLTLMSSPGFAARYPQQRFSRSTCTDTLSRNNAWGHSTSTERMCPWWWCDSWLERTQRASVRSGERNGLPWQIYCLWPQLLNCQGAKKASCQQARLRKTTELRDGPQAAQEPPSGCSWVNVKKK